MWLSNLIQAILLLSGPNNSSKNNINRSNENITDINIISRDEWLAMPSGPVNELQTPVPMIIICHTATDHCLDKASCTFTVRFIQTFHVESRQWADIAYNFLIGGDGYIYEGRGWNKVGSHTKQYNDKSLGIAFIGTFNEENASDLQFEAFQSLLKHGVATGMISKNYKMLGQRQLTATQSPGDKLFNEIAKWSHFVQKL